MQYLEFRNRMFDMGCFHLNQIYAWDAGFDRNNLMRWIKKGYITRLKQGWYAFTEYRTKPDFAQYIASRIYQPSYISLHTALSFYGIIPEAVVQITSVTSLKTMTLKNDFGEYTYKSVKNNLMFGYELKPLADGRTIPFAEPEKALLDLLYLYPFYNTRRELEELRLDNDFMSDELNTQRLYEYLSRFGSRALEYRTNLLLKIYEL